MATKVDLIKKRCPVCGRTFEYPDCSYKPETCDDPDCVHKYAHNRSKYESRAR